MQMHLNVEHLKAHSNASIKLLMHLHLNAYVKHLHLNAIHKHLISPMHNQMYNQMHAQFFE